MKTLLIVVQIIVPVLLVVVIVLQARGTGLGSAWGGGGESYRSRRGVEKILFGATVLLAVLFFLISILNILV